MEKQWYHYVWSCCCCCGGCQATGANARNIAVELHLGPSDHCSRQPEGRGDWASKVQVGSSRR